MLDFANRYTHEIRRKLTDLETSPEGLFYNSTSFVEFKYTDFESDEFDICRASVAKICDSDGEYCYDYIGGYIEANIDRRKMIVDNICLAYFPNDDGSGVTVFRDFIRFFDYLGEIGMVSGQFYAVDGSPGLELYRRFSKMRPNNIYEIGKSYASFKDVNGKYRDTVIFSCLWEDNIPKNRYIKGVLCN